MTNNLEGRGNHPASRGMKFTPAVNRGLELLAHEIGDISPTELAQGLLAQALSGLVTPGPKEPKLRFDPRTQQTVEALSARTAQSPLVI